MAPKSACWVFKKHVDSHFQMYLGDWKQNRSWPWIRFQRGGGWGQGGCFSSSEIPWLLSALSLRNWAPLSRDFLHAFIPGENLRTRSYMSSSEYGLHWKLDSTSRLRCYWIWVQINGLRYMRKTTQYMFC